MLPHVVKRDARRELRRIERLHRAVGLNDKGSEQQRPDKKIRKKKKKKKFSHSLW